MKFKMEISKELGKIWRFLGPGEEEEAVRIANTVVSPYGLKAEMMPKEHMARGAQGDEPTYTRMILLTGPNINQEVLMELSTRITNLVPVNKVMFEILDAREKPSV